MLGIYHWLTLRLTAYGEHADLDFHGGCVDISLKRIKESLRIQASNIFINHDRSLPSIPSIKKNGDYQQPDAIYLSISKIKELSKD